MRKGLRAKYHALAKAGLAPKGHKDIAGGKRSAALGLALALCCTEAPGLGCGQCDACRRIGFAARLRPTPRAPHLTSPRAACLDRGQGGRVFGDMVDGFDDVLSQVDLRENVSAIAEIEDAVGVGGA